MRTCSTCAHAHVLHKRTCAQAATRFKAEHYDAFSAEKAAKGDGGALSARPAPPRLAPPHPGDARQRACAAGIASKAIRWAKLEASLVQVVPVTGSIARGM